MQREVSYILTAVAIAVSATIFAPKPYVDSGLSFDKMYDAVPVDVADATDPAIAVASIEPSAGEEAPPSVPENAAAEQAIIDAIAAQSPQTPAPSALPAGSVAEAEPASPAQNNCLSSPVSEGSLNGFYQSQPASVTKEPRALKITSNAGVLTLQGVQYKLQYIELPKAPALPINSVSYPLEVRFVHESKSGEKLVVSVPLKEGAANPGFESLLRNNGEVSLDPNDLLPGNQHYGFFAAGNECAQGTIVLTTPVEISASQIEKFNALF